MVNLRPDQALLVEIVARKTAHRADVRVSLERQIRAELEKRLAVETADWERAITDAHLSGVPKTQIARATGSSNPKVVNEVIRRHLAERSSILSRRYSRGAELDELVIRLEGRTLEIACASTGWSTEEAVAAGTDSALFSVTKAASGDRVLVAKTPSFDRERGRLHPVVAWGRRPDNAAEALVWASSEMARP